MLEMQDHWDSSDYRYANELEEMGKVANSIAPHNVEEKIYKEIRNVVG